MPLRYLLVLATFLLSILLYVDRICISAAKDAITADLGLTDTQFGWALSAFALGYALCQTPGGWFADRFGPRRVLTAVVIFWSAFTGLTGLAMGYISLLGTRFLFGAGEAGAFPGMARAAYSWIPMSERGLVQGINFSGSRLGGAFALPVVAWMIVTTGWRMSFMVLMAIGVLWAAAWYWVFRDDPTEHSMIDSGELKYILANRQQDSPGKQKPQALSFFALLNSANVWIICAQYFCSNFTFFFCLTWLFPHLKSRFDLSPIIAACYAAAPLLCGAFGNWFAGWLVDRIYAHGRWPLSRRLPAVLGYLLAAAGLISSLFVETPLASIVCFSIAIFGADMTLAPSWSFCIDIGRRNAGVVSGTMNMAGNIGAFLTALAFPYLQEWTGSNAPFFFVAAGLNVLAVLLWMMARPDRPLEDY